MNIRQHTPGDHRRLAELRWGLKTEDLTETDMPDKAAFVTGYLGHLKDSARAGDTVHWVLDDGTGAVGVMTVRVVVKEPSLSGRAGRWGYLTNVYLVPGCRNRGEGTRLLQAVVAWARAEGLEFLLVWPSERSRAFYARAGFEGSEDPVVLELE